MLSAIEALRWMEAFITIAVVFQTIELLQIRRAWGRGGIWTESALEGDFAGFPPPVRGVFGFLMKERVFVGVLILRMLAALALPFSSYASFPRAVIPHAVIPIVLFVSSLLVSVRWRGSFNGGSDSMTLLVLAAVAVARLDPDSPRFVEGALAYVAIQVCLSYFIAGVVKLRRTEWRRGTAMTGFTGMNYYDVPDGVVRAMKSRAASLAAGWVILVFECGFPLALANPGVARAFVALALVFHLANVYVFGLNRFLFAWAAAYPALLWFSGRLHS